MVVLTKIQIVTQLTNMIISIQLIIRIMVNEKEFIYSLQNLLMSISLYLKLLRGNISDRKMYALLDKFKCTRH